MLKRLISIRLKNPHNFLAHSVTVISTLFLKDKGSVKGFMRKPTQAQLFNIVVSMEQPIHELLIDKIFKDRSGTVSLLCSSALFPVC